MKRHSRSTPALQILYKRRPTTAAVYYIKSHADYASMMQVCRAMRSRNAPFHKFVFGTVSPSSWSELYSTTPYSTDSIPRELDWLAATFSCFRDELRRFVAWRDEVDAALVAGRYDQCAALLDACEKESGLSLWSLSRRFLLLEISAGIKANTELLSQITATPKIPVLLNLVATYLSLRAESKLSVDNYLLRVQKLISQINPGLYHAHLSHVLEPFAGLPEQLYPQVAAAAGYMALVDRYMTFLALAHRLATNECSIATLIPALRRVAAMVDDPVIARLTHVFADPTATVPEPVTGQVLEALDFYTSGDYQRSQKLSGDLLSKYPTIFSLYDVHVKSSIYSNRPLGSPFSLDSIGAQLLGHLENIHRRNQHGADSLGALHKLAYQMANSSLGWELIAFRARELHSADAQRVSTIALLNSAFPSPRIFPAGATYRTAFLDTLNNTHPSSLTVKFSRALVDGVAPQDLPSAVADTRRLIYGARHFCAASNHDAAIASLRELDGPSSVLSDGGRQLVDRDARVALFRCYLHTSRLFSALDLALATHLSDPALARHMQIGDLLAAIDREKPSDVLSSILYPLLYTLYAPTPRAIYVAYDNFLAAHGATKPSELIPIASAFQGGHLRMFFQRTCTLPVLACSWRFSGGTDAIESERIALCQFLATRGGEAQVAALQEIADIKRRAQIRQGIRHIDQSRIYVDEPGIRSAADAILRENFERLLDVAKLDAAKVPVLLDTRNLTLLTTGPDGTVVRVQPTPDMLFSADNLVKVSRFYYSLFTDFFFDIRDRFISSNEHGLDSYLSIRIRHGILQNQLRAPLEAHALLCPKEGDGYGLNSYWETRLSDSSAEFRSAVQRLLVDFTQRIDNVVSRLNEQVIQVKTEARNPEGYFDYAFAEGELLRLVAWFREVKPDYAATLDSLFALLWRRTEANLAKIRECILDEAKNLVYQALTDLAHALRNLDAAATAPDLLSYVTEALTTGQRQMDRIARWFTIPAASSARDFTMEELVEICVTSLSHLYPQYRTPPDLRIDSKPRFVARSFAHLFDVVTALLANALNHSGVPVAGLGIEVHVRLDERQLLIHVANDISQEVRSTDPVDRVNRKLHELQTGGTPSAVRHEGGTGYVKIRKILDSDLARSRTAVVASYDAKGRFVVEISMNTEGLTVGG